MAAGASFVWIAVFMAGILAQCPAVEDAATMIENLEKLIGTPRDGALLRYSLGIEYSKAGKPEAALVHLREAVARDASYSAAWKLLGRALAESGDAEGAKQAYRAGIEAAGRKGDNRLPFST